MAGETCRYSILCEIGLLVGARSKQVALVCSDLSPQWQKIADVLSNRRKPQRRLR